MPALAGSGVKWYGDRAKRYVDSLIDKKMNEIGRNAAAEAKATVRVDTGQTRDSIGAVYRQSDKTLQLYADTPWAVYLEERYPFLRPALLKAATLWGKAGSFEVAFPNAPDKPSAARAGARMAGDKRSAKGVLKKAKLKVGRR